MISLRTIIGLFFSRGPSAIAGLIVAVVVYAVNPLTKWGFAHIRKELTKRFSPLGANRNAATPIPWPALDIGICTSLNHCLPTMISPGRCMSWAVSMFSPCTGFTLSGLTKAQIASGDRCAIATEPANAYPSHPSTISHRVGFYYKPMPINFASHIFYVTHNRMVAF